MDESNTINEMSSSERFPSSQPLMSPTGTEYGTEPGSLNHESNDHSENETGGQPWNADLLEKRTTQVLKVLQLLGLVTGHRSRRLGNLFVLFIALITWIPPIFLSTCLAKDPIMSSPSGLPTILLFSGLALSHHFGALYGYKHRGRLRRNVSLAIERSNFFRTCVVVLALFAILTFLYLFPCKKDRSMSGVHASCVEQLHPQK